ncbi:hypothetical protein [Candidatus Phytoplasma oryzae]|nr:hypothetical protein PIE28_01830 [Candidatus Phytoplasma oryzae]
MKILIYLQRFSLRIKKIILNFFLDLKEISFLSFLFLTFLKLIQFYIQCSSQFYFLEKQLLISRIDDFSYWYVYFLCFFFYYLIRLSKSFLNNQDNQHDC